jgi:perosamine synthetase
VTTGVAERALAILEECLPPERPVPLHEPTFGGREWELVKDCLDSGWVSSAGSYVGRFEQMLADYTGIAHAVAIVNGTAALHLALLAAGVRPGDEVIVPSLTFVATANAVSHCGATPHFADVEDATLGLDPAALEKGLNAVGVRRDGVLTNRHTRRPIRAVLMMHTFGHPADAEGLASVCARFDLPLIEDAAEAIGSTRDGVHVGGTGLMSVLSFNGNKTITTGGGGAVLTRDAKIAQRLKHLSTTARVGGGWEFDHDEVGYNYRLPNLNAALGCAQLEILPELIDAKRRLAQRYSAAFDHLNTPRFVREPAGACSNYWLNGLLFDKREDRDLFLSLSNARRIQTRPPWRLMHELPMHRDCPRMDLARCEDLAGRLVNLPSSPVLATR